MPIKGTLRSKLLSKASLDVASLTGANAAAALLRLLAGIVIARVLGPSGRGVYALINVTSDAAERATSRGYPEALAYLAKERPHELTTLYGDAKARLIRSGWITLPLGIAAGTVWPSDIPVGGRISLSAAIGLAPWLGSLRQLARASAVAKGYLKGLAFMELLRAAPLVAVVVLPWLPATEHRASGLIYVALGVLLSVGNWMALRYGANQADLRAYENGPPSSSGRALQRYAKDVRWFSILNIATNRIDQLVLAAVASVAVLGTYSASVSIALLPVHLSLAVTQWSYAKFRVAETGLSRRAVLRALRPGAFVTAIQYAVLIPTSPFLVRLLFGAEFVPTAAVPVVVALSGLLFSLSLAVQNILVGAGIARPPSMANFLAILVTVAGLALFGHRGALAAGIVSVVAYSVRLAVLIPAVLYPERWRSV